MSKYNQIIVRVRKPSVTEKTARRLLFSNYRYFSLFRKRHLFLSEVQSAAIYGTNNVLCFSREYLKVNTFSVATPLAVFKSCTEYYNICICHPLNLKCIAHRGETCTGFLSDTTLSSRAFGDKNNFAPIHMLPFENTRANLSAKPDPNKLTQLLPETGDH